MSLCVLFSRSAATSSPPLSTMQRMLASRARASAASTLSSRSFNLTQQRFAHKVRIHWPAPWPFRLPNAAAASAAAC